MTDQTCICTDPSLNANVNTCVQLGCTIKESLSKCSLSLFSCFECETHRPSATKNVTLTACHSPVRDRTRVVSVSGMAGLAVAALAFFLRMAARFRCCGGQFGWDDGTMVFTMVRFNINAGKRTPRANSAQLLVVPLSAFSVVCMFSPSTIGGIP